MPTSSKLKLVVNGKDVSSKPNSNLSPVYSLGSPSNQKQTKFSTKDFKADDVKAKKDVNELTEYEKIQSRIEDIVSRANSPIYSPTNNKKVADNDFEENPEIVLINSLKSIAKLVQSMEKIGLTRDDILNRIMGQLALSKPLGLSEEDLAVREMDEAEKSIQEADKVLFAVREACRHAQTKMDNLINAVKVKLANSVSLNMSEGDRAMKDAMIHNLSKNAANGGDVQLILNELIHTRNLLSSRDEEFQKAQINILEAQQKIKDLEVHGSKKIAHELKASKFQIGVLLALGKEKEHVERDVGLELHLDQSRSQRESDMAKENLTKTILKMKKLVKEMAELQKEYDTCKETLKEEEAKSVRLQNELTETRETSEETVIALNRKIALEGEKYNQEKKALEMAMKVAVGNEKEAAEKALQSLNIKHEKDVDAIQSELKYMRNSYNKLEDENAALKKSIEKLKSGHEEEVKTLNSNIKSLNSQNEGYINEIKQLKNDKMKSESELMSLQVNSSSNNMHEFELAKEIEELKKTYVIIFDEVKNKDESINQLHDLLNESHNECAELHEMIEKYKQEIQQLQQIKSEPVLINEKVIVTVPSVVNNNNAEEEINKLKAQISEKDKRYSVMLKDLKNAKDETTEAIQNLNDRNQSYASELLSVQEAMQTLLELAVNVKSTMKNNDSTLKRQSTRSILQAETPDLSTFGLQTTFIDKFKSVISQIEPFLLATGEMSSELESFQHENDSLRLKNLEKEREIVEMKEQDNEKVVTKENIEIKTPEKKNKKIVKKTKGGETALDEPTSNEIIPPSTTVNNDYDNEALAKAKEEIETLAKAALKRTKQNNQLKKEVSRLRTEVEHYHGLLSRTTAVLDSVKNQNEEVCLLDNDITNLLSNADAGIVQFIPAVMWLQGAVSNSIGTGSNNSEPSVSIDKRRSPSPVFTEKVENVVEAIKNLDRHSPNELQFPGGYDNYVQIAENRMGSVEEVSGDFAKSHRRLNIVQPENSSSSTPTKIRRPPISFSRGRSSVDDGRSKSILENDPDTKLRTRTSVFDGISVPLNSKKSISAANDLENEKLRGRSSPTDEFEKENDSIPVPIVGARVIRNSSLFENEGIPNAEKEGFLDDGEDIDDEFTDSLNAKTRKLSSPADTEVKHDIAPAVEFVQRHRQSNAMARSVSFSRKSSIASKSSNSIVEENNKINQLNSKLSNSRRNVLEGSNEANVESKGTVVDCQVLALARAEHDLREIMDEITCNVDNTVDELNDEAELLKQQVEILREEVMSNEHQVIDKETLDPTVDVSDLDQNTQILIFQRIRLHLIEQLEIAKKEVLLSNQNVQTMRDIVEKISQEKADNQSNVTEINGSVSMDSALTNLIFRNTNSMHNLICDVQQAACEISSMLLIVKSLNLESFKDIINNTSKFPNNKLFLEEKQLQQQYQEFANQKTPSASNSNANVIHQIKMPDENLLPSVKLPNSPSFNNVAKYEMGKSLNTNETSKSSIQVAIPDITNDKSIDGLSEYDNKLGVVSHKAIFSHQYTLSNKKSGGKVRAKEKQNNSIYSINTTNYMSQVVTSNSESAEKAPSLAEIQELEQINASLLEKNELLRIAIERSDEYKKLQLQMIEKLQSQYDVFKPMNNISKMTFEAWSQEGVVIPAMEKDFDVLQEITSALHSVTNEIHELEPGKLWSLNESLKVSVEKLTKERSELVLERDEYKKMGPGYGALEISESILRREKNIKLVRSGEKYRKFEVSLKLKRIQDQLEKDIFLDQKTRTALRNVKKLLRNEIRDHNEKLKKLDVNRQSTFGLLVSTFDRVREIAMETFGDELFTKLVDEVKMIETEEKYKKWEEHNLLDSYNSSLASMQEGYRLMEMNDITELPSINEKKKVNHFDAERSKLSSSGSKVRRLINSRNSDRPPSSPIRQIKKNNLEDSLIDFNSSVSRPRTALDSPTKIKDPNFIHNLAPLNASRLPGSSFGNASRTGQGYIFAIPRASEFESKNDREETQFIIRPNSENNRGFSR